MDVHTKEQRSYNMSRVKSKNTRPEKIIYLRLKKAGYKFKKHYNVPGKPDVVLLQYKIAIFIDGEFWHGRSYCNWKNKISPFWQKKIGDTIIRDKKNRHLLSRRGWHVLRLWDKFIMKNPDKSLLKIAAFIEKFAKTQ